jgi:hypothetical protein
MVVMPARIDDVASCVMMAGWQRRGGGTQDSDSIRRMIGVSSTALFGIRPIFRDSAKSHQGASVPIHVMGNESKLDGCGSSANRSWLIGPYHDCSDFFDCFNLDGTTGPAKQSIPWIVQRALVQSDLASVLQLHEITVNAGNPDRRGKCLVLDDPGVADAYEIQVDPKGNHHGKSHESPKKHLHSRPKVQCDATATRFGVSGWLRGREKIGIHEWFGHLVGLIPCTNPLVYGFSFSTRRLMPVCGSVVR